ncbi:branched-chain amino acid ABC transporter permease [Bordetella genomosp. 11]|uniref:Branched-chain amino acid ABC transporter permease n=1 Tax=Bordetella genomosp. 11 TaxID=1416808 RepID=A0A261UZZ1_9BORD|nr:branched-chain amino acid ABC transporter permease [Bordetella genomosp. 11]OZI67171.1 branched-chain amino acid ABC transporter permease [Bordetella genomosp. 11]
MNAQIALILGQDGVANGAVYALLALCILLVFSVTRVLLIPQGEFVVYGALCMASMQNGRMPALVWLLCAFAVAETIADARAGARGSATIRPVRLAGRTAYPFLLAGALWLLPLASLPVWLQAVLTLAIVAPMGPQLYRLFYQPIADASTLILLIVSIAVHLALVGLGLLAFGPEGARAAPFSDARYALGPASVASQTLWVVAVSLLWMLALYRFFGRTLPGRALRAAADNRAGARLVGISPEFAGRAVFLLAATLGACSGILVGPAATLYYDSGFLISLKGFVAAIVGGLTSYPLAVIGALAVGLVESFSAFWASAYKEIIVFTLIIPFLLWRSLRHGTIEDETE